MLQAMFDTSLADQHLVVFEVQHLESRFFWEEENRMQLWF